MFGIDIEIPFEAGNMLLWLWLEIAALGAMIKWTSILAKILVRRRLSKGKPVRLQWKRTTIDKLPCNGDLRPLAPVPKVALTLIRVLVMVLVAFSAIGIESGDAFYQWQPTTHVVELNDKRFKGKSYDVSKADSIEDVSVVGCEKINSKSLRKHKAFVSKDTFSCNDGKRVGNQKQLVEVIWNRKVVREIVSKGKLSRPNVILGDNSCLNRERKSRTTLAVQSCSGALDEMFISRRTFSDDRFKFLSCGNSVPREFLVVSNNLGRKVEMENVTVALVLCGKSKPVYLRNTDKMVYLSDLGAMQQIILARKVGNALLSIVPDKGSRVYDGNIRKVTSVQRGYDLMIVILSGSNILLLLVFWIYHRYSNVEISVDAFSPHSMFMLADSCHKGLPRCDMKRHQDVLIEKATFGSSWDIQARLEDKWDEKEEAPFPGIS